MNKKSKYQKTLDFLNKLYKTRILVYTLIAVVIVIAGGLFFKKKVVRENNIIINAPIEKVWNHINSLPKIIEWALDTVVEFETISSESKVGTTQYVLKKDSIKVLEFEIIGSESKVGKIKYVLKKNSIRIDSSTITINKIKAPNYLEAEMEEGEELIIFKLQHTNRKTSLKVVRRNRIPYTFAILKEVFMFKDHFNEFLPRLKKHIEDKLLI